MGFSLYLNDLIVARQFCQEPSSFGCSIEFLNFAALVMQQNNMQLPTTTSEAQDLCVNNLAIRKLMEIPCSLSTSM